MADALLALATSGSFGRRAFFRVRRARSLSFAGTGNDRPSAVVQCQNRRGRRGKGSDDLAAECLEGLLRLRLTRHRVAEMQRNLCFSLEKPRLLLSSLRRGEQGAADDGDQQEDAEGH